MTKTAGYLALGLGVFASLGLIACGDEDATDVRPYTDSAGRSCNVDLDDISRTATCDVAASTLVTCDVGQEAAIVVDDGYDVDTMVWTQRSCTACVDRPARRSYIQDCATVDCVVDADCLSMPYTCRGRLCQHD